MIAYHKHKTQDFHNSITYSSTSDQLFFCLCAVTYILTLRLHVEMYNFTLLLKGEPPSSGDTVV